MHIYSNIFYASKKEWKEIKQNISSTQTFIPLPPFNFF